MTTSRTLDDWLRYQEQLHPQAIDMGLARIHEVLTRLGWQGAPWPVVTVAGTNGKGSCVTYLEGIWRAAGYRVGSYTSPHLLHYSERIRINGQPVTDDALCQAFSRVEAARQTTSLTYFEYGTLAALDLFHREPLDGVILEVGLGGRLDATNVVDATVALITTVDLDHQDWLGPDRESIGWEKAGIFRSGRPGVCGDPQPPTSVVTHAAQLGVSLYQQGREFGWQPQGEEGWGWWGPAGQRRHALPEPALRGTFQRNNASAVLMVVDQLKDCLPVTAAAVREGLVTASLPGRFQVLGGTIPTILDVAHNPQAAQALAATLRAMPRRGRISVVVGMLKDKDIEGTLRALVDVVDGGWYPTGLPGPRGLDGFQLATVLQTLQIRAAVRCYSTPQDGYQEALNRAQSGDVVLVTGSFLTVAAILSVAL